METVRESLGGPWYASFAGWLVVLPGVVLLVVGQDSVLRTASVLLVLASALLQHLVAGVVFFLVSGLSHLRWQIVPLPLAIIGWVGSAVARGVVGGLFAAATIRVPPDLPYRIVTWVLIVAATQPLITYLLSQIDRRRALLGQWEAAVANLLTARTDARQSTAVTRLRLVSTVRDTIDPVMWEVRSSLGSLSADTDADPTFLSKIGERLQVITEDIDQILTDPHPRDSSDSSETAPRAELIAAVDFPPSHFVLSAVLPPLLVVALLGPGAWRNTGLSGLEEIVAAALTSSGVLALAFVVQIGLHAQSAQVRLFALRIGFVLAGLAASTASFLTALGIGGTQDATILYILPVAVAVAAALVMGGLGISAANRKLADVLGNINEDNEKLRESTAARDRRVTAQVATLLHGPVIGRLSACVMAINLRPKETDSPGGFGSTPVATRILRHLEAAANDLEVLSRG